MLYIYCIPNGFATGEELHYASEKVIKIPSACYLPNLAKRILYTYINYYMFIYIKI